MAYLLFLFSYGGNGNMQQKIGTALLGFVIGTGVGTVVILAIATWNMPLEQVLKNIQILPFLVGVCIFGLLGAVMALFLMFYE